MTNPDVVRSRWTGKLLVFVTVEWPMLNGKLAQATMTDDDAERMAASRMKQGLPTWCVR